RSAFSFASLAERSEIRKESHKEQQVERAEVPVGVRAQQLGDECHQQSERDRRASTEPTQVAHGEHEVPAEQHEQREVSDNAQIERDLMVRELISGPRALVVTQVAGGSTESGSHQRLFAKAFHEERLLDTALVLGGKSFLDAIHESQRGNAAR